MKRTKKPLIKHIPNKNAKILRRRRVAVHYVREALPITRAKTAQLNAANGTSTFPDVNSALVTAERNVAPPPVEQRHLLPRSNEVVQSHSQLSIEEWYDAINPAISLTRTRSKRVEATCHNCGTVEIVHPIYNALVTAVLDDSNKHKGDSEDLPTKRQGEPGQAEAMNMLEECSEDKNLIRNGILQPGLQASSLEPIQCEFQVNGCNEGLSDLGHEDIKNPVEGIATSAMISTGVSSIDEISMTNELLDEVAPSVPLDYEFNERTCVSNTCRDISMEDISEDNEQRLKERTIEDGKEKQEIFQPMEPPSYRVQQKHHSADGHIPCEGGDNIVCESVNVSCKRSKNRFIQIMFDVIDPRWWLR